MLFVPMPYTIVLACLAWLYTLSLIGYWLWIRLNLPRPWWFKAFSPFALWAFLPTVMLPPLGIIAPSFAYWIAAILGSGLFIIRFLLPMFPRHRYAPGDDRSVIKLMTVNLCKKNLRWQQIIEALLAELPNVIALQEVKPEHVRAIERHLADAYPYRELYPGVDFEGMGLLSRTPFLSAELHRADDAANPTQVVSVELAGQKVWIVNIHARIPLLRTKTIVGIAVPAGLDTSDRQADIEQIIEIVEGLRGDAIVLGDMNATDQCLEYRMVPPHWHDVYREVGKGPGLTYPIGVPVYGYRTSIPLFRIDYTFYRGNWRAVSARTGKMPGSDHRYLVVELALPCK